MNGTRAVIGIATIAVAACYSSNGDPPTQTATATVCTADGCHPAPIADGGADTAPPSSTSQPGGGGATFDAEVSARCPGVDLDSAPHVATAGGQFIAGGVSRRSTVSGDGAHWESDGHVEDPDAAAPPAILLSIAVGPGLLVAASYTGIQTSTDGKTWTPRSVPPVFADTYFDTGFDAAAYGKGTYVVAANPYRAALALFHSTSGTSWTEPPLYVTTAGGYNRPIYSLIFANDKFVGVGGGRRSIVSDDGITWHDDRIPTDAHGNEYADEIYYSSVAFGNGVYVAVGSRSTIAHSTDGIDWIDVDPDAGTKPIGDFTSVVFDGGKFVTCVRGGCFSTLDGATWTALSTAVAEPRPTMAMLHHDGFFIGIDIPAQILTSNDAVTWTPVFCGAPPALRTVAFFPSP